MAGLGAKLFTAFSKLTAAQVNGYLMDQSIMRFASTAARDAAFGGAGEPTLAEGMTCYLDDTNVLQSYTGSAWVEIACTDGKAPRGVVGYVTKATTQTAITTETDLSGLSITWTAAAGRVYKFTAHLNLSSASGGDYTLFINDGSTNILEAAEKLAAGDRESCDLEGYVTGITAGSKTYKLRLTATNDTTVFGSSTRASIASQFIIEDIGSA
jgi:hypothetical protein